MKKTIFCLLLVVVLTGSACNVKKTEEPSSASDAGTNEAEAIFEEMDRLVKEADQIARYGNLGLTRQNEKISALSKQVSALAAQYFSLTESYSDPEVQNLAKDRNLTPRFAGQFVRAKSRAMEVEALWDRYAKLYEQLQESEMEELLSEIYSVTERLTELGIDVSNRAHSVTKTGTVGFNAFEDNDDFSELMKREGFTILNSGTGILAAGVDETGREWRVVGDRPDADLGKLALVSRSSGEPWKMERVSEKRDAHLKMLSLSVGLNDYVHFNYGAVDPEERTGYLVRSHELHLFCQGQGAKKEINYDLLASLMPRNCVLQLWQKGENYVIHLVYYGSWGIMDELSQWGATEMYYTLKGLGIFEEE